jgi:hypothetical protein
MFSRIMSQVEANGNLPVNTVVQMEKTSETGLARGWCGRVQELCDVERHLELSMRGNRMSRTP